MPRLFHPFRAGAILCLLLAVLSGCSRAPVEESGVRRIVYWEKWTGFEGEAMTRVVDLFNRRQREHAESEPDYLPIEIEMVVVADIEQKLLVAIAGGTPPDVAGTYDFMIPIYSEKGALMDLTERLSAAGIEEEDYVPVYWESGRHRGRMWSVPTVPTSLALHWNKRLFKEAGLDPERAPKTIEELNEFTEKLTRWEVTREDGTTEIRTGYLPNVPPDRKRLVQVGFLPSEPAWWNWLWGFYFGGKLVDGDRISAADPENVRAYEWVASFPKNIGIDQIQRFRSGFGNFSSPQNPFMAGKVAMILQGVWMANFIDRYSPGMQWGAAPFPYPADRPDLENSTDVEADVLAIPTDSARVEEAFEFIKFVATQEATELLCMGQKKHSPRRVTSEEFRRTHPHPYLELFQTLPLSGNTFTRPRIAARNEYIREMIAAMDRIQNLSIEPRPALQGVEQRMQRAYDRDRAAYARRYAH